MPGSPSGARVRDVAPDARPLAAQVMFGQVQEDMAAAVAFVIELPVRGKIRRAADGHDDFRRKLPAMVERVLVRDYARRQVHVLRNSAAHDARDQLEPEVHARESRVELA